MKLVLWQSSFSSIFVYLFLYLLSRQLLSLKPGVVARILWVSSELVQVVPLCQPPSTDLPSLLSWHSFQLSLLSFGLTQQHQQTCFKV